MVHTRNFRAEQSDYLFFRMSGALEVTEYFTLNSNDELGYRYSVSDPEIYSRPFTVEMALRRMPDNERLYESACHEGNYGLTGILAGARRLELDPSSDD